MLRRNFLLHVGTIALALSPLPKVRAELADSTFERRLQLLNLNTGEYLNLVYWTPQGYIAEALARINHLMRDHHTNDVMAIDTALIERLFDLKSKLGSGQAICILSAYRSPRTNLALSHRVRGVAKNSFHMKGQAVDIRLPGCHLQSLREAALQQVAGGVGYYPAKDFVHIDVGPCRQWEQRLGRHARPVCRAPQQRSKKGRKTANRTKEHLSDERHPVT